MGYTVLYILLISFAATLVRSTFGFGESLTAVPLFMFFLPTEVAVPLSVLLSVTVALVVVVQDHEKIHLYSAKWLIIFAIPGIPAGLLILSYGDEYVIKIGLGLLIILYAGYSLLGKKRFPVRRDSKILLFICGFLSGVLGGAYGLNGPPLVVYGHLSKWNAGQLRATLQAYFLPASLLGITGYLAKGLMTQHVFTDFLIALPAAIPAIFLGRYLNRRLKNDSFFRYVYCGLILIGVSLVLNTWRG